MNVRTLITYSVTLGLALPATAIAQAVSCIQSAQSIKALEACDESEIMAAEGRAGDALDRLIAKYKNDQQKVLMLKNSEKLWLEYLNAHCMTAGNLKLPPGGDLRLSLEAQRAFRACVVRISTERLRELEALQSNP
jgi:uncharacterized protein YecT (DUF1311 family)